MGVLRIRARVISGRREYLRATGFVSCRLTAFIYPPGIVQNMARRITPSQLNQARRQFLERAPSRHLRRDLRLFALLSLQLNGACKTAKRRHPALLSAWLAFVRCERRRMLRRLRNAVQRLERAGRRGGP